MSELNKINILLVDDDNMFRLSLRDLIEEKGYPVSEAADGEEALRQLEARDFDLVITDILMPDSDGFELLQYLNKRPKPVKVIVITGGGLIEAEKYLLLASNTITVLTGLRLVQRSYFNSACQLLPIRE